MKEIIDLLSAFVTDNKKRQIEKVLEERTKYLTVVLEDIYQSHNASAVVRTCECFGVQDLHIIENLNRYDINPKVVMGATKWVDMYHYCLPDINNSVSCITNLKQKGYRILVTSPDENAQSIDEFNLEGKMAIVFGTEQLGVSDDIMNMADEKVTIPMYGFTESLNISVSAALALNTIKNRLKSSDIDWRLSDVELETIKLEWYKKLVKGSDIIIQNYNKNKASEGVDEK